VGGGPGGHDAQRQRQPGAGGDDLRHRRRLGRHPARAEPAGQQLARFREGQQVQVHRAGTLGRDQAGELVAAGHHRYGVRSARQQRAYLLRVAGVVEHYQHPFAGQDAAEEGGLGAGAGRYPYGRYAEGLKESAYRLAGRHWPHARAEAT